jgi:protein-S-isoprenylcysteine O-methyltransferase Ste14
MTGTGWWRNSRGEYYVAGQIVLVLLVLIGPRFGAGVDLAAAGRLAPGMRVAPWSTVTAAAGALIGGGGLALCIAGVLRLGPNLTPFPKPKDGAVLVENGVYAVVRHPIYGGVSLAALGWALAWRSPVTLGLSVLLFLFFDIKSRREEQWLRRTFPQYAGYARRVKKLIPRIY